MRQRSWILATVFLGIFGLHATSVSAQGRISGVVNDEAGKPIKAATVTAVNNDSNQQLTATTDEKGRFSMIGLRSGAWRFVAQAPGYFSDEGTTTVRSSGSPNAPIGFSLKKTSLLAGALGGVTAKDLQGDLAGADALFNQQKWDEAISAYQAIIRDTPSLSVINLQLAAAFFNKKDYDGALSAYNSLLQSDPTSDKATVGIARVQMAKGDLAAAEESLTKATAQAGREVFYALGDLKFEKNEIDEAITWYQKASELDPSWGKAWYKLGLCAQKKGDPSGTAGFMNKVLAVDPVSPEAAMARAALDQLKK